MAYWLIKSEPLNWSWDDQVKAGAKGTPWTGVRNHLAKKHLQTMRKGDHCFFYHSNVGKEIVGICEVVREAYADPIAGEASPWLCVNMKALTPLRKSVTLENIKNHPSLKNMALVKSARLSVQPVTDQEWKAVCAMGGINSNI